MFTLRFPLSLPTADETAVIEPIEAAAEPMNL
jgi:hypothetical protein